jgi:hypothetical protein
VPTRDDLREDFRTMGRRGRAHWQAIQRTPGTLLALALCAALASCEDPAPDWSGVEGRGGGEAGGAPPAIQVTGIDLGRAIGPDLRISEAAEAFHPRDTIYVSVVTEGSAPAATVTARWRYRSGEGGELIEETTQAIAPRGREVTEFHIARPDGWPPGRYEVQILLDGRPTGSRAFSVVEAPA